MTTETVPEFTITRTLDAPRELVWRAWTDPRHLTHWFHPHGVSTPEASIDVDVREGGRYRYTMIVDETGEEFPTGGVFLEVVPGERLVFTWGGVDDPVEESPVATVTLADAGEGTDLVFRLRGVDAGPGDDDVYDGWSEALTELATHLERR